MKRLIFTVVFGLIPIAVWGLGCGSAPSSPPKQTTPSGGHDHGHGDHGEHGSDAKDGQAAMEKMKETLAKLPEADRQSAEKQHTWPVSGDMLGTTGVPLKVEVNGREVWICCKDCEAPLKADPEKYLAKLK